MVRWFWAILLWTLISAAPLAHAGKGPFGDDDYYPVGCVDLSGRWKNAADPSKSLDIVQKDCKALRISAEQNHKVTDIIDIDPNGKTYREDCSGCSSQTRGSWDSSFYGAVLQTYRETSYSDRNEVEVVYMQKVKEKHLLVQSIHYVLKREDDTYKRTVQEEWYVHE